MKLAPVASIFPLNKTSPKGVAIWQATVRIDGKDRTCTGSESEVRTWAMKEIG